MLFKFPHNHTTDILHSILICLPFARTRSLEPNDAMPLQAADYLAKAAEKKELILRSVGTEVSKCYSTMISSLLWLVFFNRNCKSSLDIFPLLFEWPILY